MSGEPFAIYCIVLSLPLFIIWVIGTLNDTKDEFIISSEYNSYTLKYFHKIRNRTYLSILIPALALLIFNNAVAPVVYAICTIYIVYSVIIMVFFFKYTMGFNHRDKFYKNYSRLVKFYTKYTYSKIKKDLNINVSNDNSLKTLYRFLILMNTFIFLDTVFYKKSSFIDDDKLSYFRSNRSRLSSIHTKLEKLVTLLSTQKEYLKLFNENSKTMVDLMNEMISDFNTNSFDINKAYTYMNTLDAEFLQNLESYLGEYIRFLLNDSESSKTKLLNEFKNNKILLEKLRKGETNV